MFTQEIALQIWRDTEIEILTYHFEMLLQYYRMNGQIISEHEPLFMESNFIKCNVSTLEIDSLLIKHNTNKVNDQISEIENLFLSAPTFKLHNHVPIVDEIPVCTCKKSKSNILTASCLFKKSPIECGDCFRQIPLYKMIHLREEVKESILNWQKNYECCEHLQMSGLVSKEWASVQMANHKSELSKIGINFCNELFTVTGIPTFYYLLNCNKDGLKSEINNLCPKCNGDWRLSDPTLLSYHFQCNNCKLISDFAGTDYEMMD